jgi:ATP-dependent Clp protease ATP-binding subunit ClpA
MGVTKQAAQKRFVPGRGDPSEEGLFQRFTVRARRVVEVAHEEARRMRSAAVSPEHLLVGLVTDPEGLSAKALASQGITPDHVRGAVAASGLATVDEVGDRVPFGSDTKKILGFGLREALRRRHNYIGTEHLLLGAMTDDTMGSARILTRLGADLDTTREWIDRFLGDLVEEKTGFRPELAD